MIRNSRPGIDNMPNEPTKISAYPKVKNRESFDQYVVVEERISVYWLRWRKNYAAYDVVPPHLC